MCVLLDYLVSYRMVKIISFFNDDVRSIIMEGWRFVNRVSSLRSRS